MSDRQNPTPCLLKSHLTALQARGLSVESIRLASLRSESDPERIQRILGWEGPARLGPSIVIPFFDITGSPTSYSRLRPDSPRKLDGDRVAKYESPLGQPGRCYFPPRIREVRSEPTEPVIIVEGEFKSLVADQHGRAAIGITGVSMWSKPRATEAEERSLHPDLLDITWTGRLVYIAFDSDAVYKDAVRWEEWRLAKALTAAGADVRIVRIPARLGGPKVGLDDLLATAGKTAAAVLNALLAQAQDPVPPPQGFTNVIQRPNLDKPGAFIEFGRGVDEMALELVGRSRGWPRMVGGLLVGPDSVDAVRPIKDANALSAMIHGFYDSGGSSRVIWKKGPSFPSRQELFCYLESHSERFERADRLPHVPPLTGVFYTQPAPIPDGQFSAIARFLEFFQPATPEDQSLLVAMLMTLFWGGPAGTRPAFLIEGEENDPEAGRGVGKTTVAQKFARLAGGAFELDASEPFARTRSRLLTPEAGGYRMLLMDNVKTFRLSSADLESLITNPFINGHRLYHGQAGVPNYYTLVLTLNGASLSKDVAQRVVTIRLKRVPYRPDWNTQVDQLIDRHRDQIIADVIGLLQRKPAVLPEVGRWGPWESQVLARVERPAACWSIIRERAKQHDADGEDAERIRETLGEIVERLDGSDIHEQRFLLSSAAVTKLIALAFNNRAIPAANASAAIKALGVKGFRKSDRKGLRLWEWRGDHYASATPRELPPSRLMFDPNPGRDDMGRSIPERWFMAAPQADLADG